MDCIFCKISQKEIPTKLIYEDANIVAFDDLHPKAPIHKLIIPRKHISTLNDLDKNDCDVSGQMILVATKIAKELNIAENGYRLIMNCNKDGGQAVFHIHLHLLGGREMNWPPG